VDPEAGAGNKLHNPKTIRRENHTEVLLFKYML